MIISFLFSQHQITIEKQRNDELISLLEKREIELNNIRSLVDKKEKRIVRFFFLGIQKYDFLRN